jgi:hypothetical protein
MSTSLLRIVVCFLFKEAYFYADWLPVTSRCAIRGISNGRIARVIFQISGGEMILLHGFIKKTQQTPQQDLELADRRRREYESHA